MRSGAAFVIIGTAGAEGIKPSLTVGNGLCAVPLRGEYNLCGQNETTPRYVIPSERSESRNLPKLQILPCVCTFLPRGGFLHSAYRCGRNDIMGERFYGFAYCFQNVSGRTAASSVRAAPCQLPRRGSFCTGIAGAGVVGNGSVLSGAERHIGRSLRFRWWVGVFNRGVLRTGGRVLRIAATSGAMVKHSTLRNCQLSIVNCQLGQNCPLSTVNCQLKPHPLARLLLMSARASVASGAVVSWVARSLRLRMPQSLPFSRMGRRRICWRPMRWAATPASMSGRA